jgi:hypothetical protein
LEKASIFLPPLMVERNVLGSNLRFLAVTAGVMIGLLSKVANAPKASSNDEGRMNAQERREQHQASAGTAAIRSTK